MSKSSAQVKRRRLTHTSVKELRAVNSVATALRIIDQYSAASKDFLVEVCYVLAEIAECLESDVFAAFTDRCLADHGVLFRSTEHMKVMIEVGRGRMTEKALKASLLRGVGASYLNMLQTKVDRGGATKAEFNRAVDKALKEADPAPLSEALGFSKVKLPLKKKRQETPYIADVELTEKGVLVVITSTGMQYRISSEKVVKGIQRLWRAKQKEE